MGTSHSPLSLLPWNVPSERSAGREGLFTRRPSPRADGQSLPPHSTSSNAQFTTRRSCHNGLSVLLPRAHSGRCRSGWRACLRARAACGVRACARCCAWGSAARRSCLAGGTRGRPCGRGDRPVLLAVGGALLCRAGAGVVLLRVPQHCTASAGAPGGL